VCGIGEGGELLISAAEGLEAFVAGEFSFEMAQEDCAGADRRAAPQAD
jgi:hypothetical protein